MLNNKQKLEALNKRIKVVTEDTLTHTSTRVAQMDFLLNLRQELLYSSDSIGFKTK